MLRRLESSLDMEQNSADAQGFKRSAEIHFGEVQRARVSSAQAPRQAKLFCGISVTIVFIFILYITDTNGSADAGMGWIRERVLRLKSKPLCVQGQGRSLNAALRRIC